MEKYIKYKRVDEKLTAEELQDFFDNLIIDGWEIIYYHEELIGVVNTKIHIVLVVGKKQSNVL